MNETSQAPRVEITQLIKYQLIAFLATQIYTAGAFENITIPKAVTIAKDIMREVWNSEKKGS